MGFFNLIGLCGTAIGIVLPFLVLPVIEWFGCRLTTVQELSYGLVLWQFGAALFGFVIDRCEIDGFLASYWANTTQFFYSAMGQTPRGHFVFRSGRRLAVFIWPLAFGPFLLLTLSTFAWIIDAVQGNQLAANTEHAIYWFTAFSAAALATLFAWLTRGLRRAT